MPDIVSLAWRAPLVCSLLFVLMACAGGPPAPIEDRRTAATTHLPLPAGNYIVRRGDTLYSIAFRFGQDFRDLAASNGIVPPYTIYPGQQLRVNGSRGGAPPTVARSGHAVRESPAAVARPEPPTAAPSVRAGEVSPGPVTGGSATPDQRRPGPVTQPPVAPPPRPSAAAAVLAPVTAWRWPSRGPVTRGYSATVHKGIDIGGQRGDPVLAVAAGQVVYAGTGIVGFGELLIVKHDDVYLSAYGHNDRLLVTEGELVRAGQEIAKKGSSGTDSVKLHFEIRKEGKPLDPLRFLPPR